MERFRERTVVNEVTGCWEWIATRITGGYGQFYANGRVHAAHRWIYAQMRGPIPPGYQIDHLCRRPSCVNPDHLEAVTPSENMRRKPRRIRDEEHAPIPITGPVRDVSRSTRQAKQPKVRARWTPPTHDKNGRRLSEDHRQHLLHKHLMRKPRRVK